jgi:Ser/Thr protein kinase RdoA (MazF antagonist)
LPAGDVTVGVVRVGDTVRRPHQPTSDGVAAYLAHLEQAGFGGAPRYLGRDAQDRDVLSFVAGDVPGDPLPNWAAADALLGSVGRLIRRLHDASDGWQPPIHVGPVPVPGRPVAKLPVGEPTLIAQRDVTPQNTVFRGSRAVGLIDFDLAGVTTRSLDVVNTAMHWVPLCDPVDRPDVLVGTDQGERLRLLLAGYGAAVSAEQLLAAAELRFAGLHASMQWNAEHIGGGWARMWQEGVGEMIVRRADWYRRERPVLAAALAGQAL